MEFSVRAAGAAVAGVVALVMAAAPDARSGAVSQAAATAIAPYTETIPGTTVTFDMVPVPGGTFTMGSPASEAGRAEDEGPQVKVKVAPFWMGKLEVTWDEYDLYAFAKRHRAGSRARRRTGADAVSKPTPPYADESWGFGKDKQPALGMTWHAAAEYCRWLSAKTGKTYRLADRGGVGIRGARRHDDAVVVGRRRPRRSATSPGTPPTAAASRTSAARRSRTRSACSTCTATSPNGCIDQHEPKRYAAPRGAAVAGGLAGERAGRGALPARRARRRLRG